MKDHSHLHALEMSLIREKARMRNTKRHREREWRQHNVRMIEKEIAGERNFLGLDIDKDDDLTLDKLYEELKDEIK